MNLSDRIALFNSGHIEQVGSPEQLYREPDTLFTARFLGDSNVFDLDGAVAGPTAGWDGRSWSIAPGTVSSHPGTAERAAVVVRPEDVRVAHDPAEVPPGSNSVGAVVRDLEYMGSYRTALLDLGRTRQLGRARVDALDSTFTVGDQVTAWWKPERQRIVAA